MFISRTTSAPGSPSLARHGLRALVAAAVGVSLVSAGTPALAAAKPVATHIAALAAPTTVKVGTKLLVSGTAKPAVSGLAVSLQRFDGHHWRTVSHVKESRTGAYVLSMKAPGKAGTLLLRVVRAAAKSDKAGVGKTLRIHVVKTSYTITAVHGATVANALPITVTGTVKPTGTGSVQLQRKLAGKWRTIATGKLTKKSTYAIGTVQKAGSYVLRMVKAQTTKVAGGLSKGFTITVAAAVAPPVLAPVISTTSLPAGVTHHPYTATLAASGGTGSLNWSAVAGALPRGLTLSTAGVLSGTPLIGGVTQLALTVTDGAARTASVTLALTISLATGTLSGWGYNGEGDLGDGIRPDRDTAAPVAGLASVTKIAGGYSTGYALNTVGAVLAYGVGTYGQLGNGGTAFSAVPVQVTGLTSGVTAISAGNATGYALKSNGTVWAWGAGDSGQLGNGGFANSLVPVQVSGLAGVTAIAGGDVEGLALKSDGTVWAWGSNVFGQLGDGSNTSSAVPVQVTGLTGQPVTAIASGSLTGYALMTDHTVRAWGENANGEIGNGGTSDLTTAAAVSGLTTATAIAASSASAFALRTGGTEVSWGYNGDGELGNGTNNDSLVPVVVPGLTTVTAIAASSFSSYALLADQTVRAWGYNGDGQLGDGTTDSNPSPVTVAGLASVTAVAGGGQVGYARKSDGTVWSWGAEVAALTDRSLAAPVAGLTGVTSAADDFAGGIALKSDGTVWDWGSNYSGQLGNPTTVQISATPVQVTGLTGVTGVTGSGTARFALKSDGTVWAWGDNSQYAFGTPFPTTSAVPVQVAGLTGVTAIASGSQCTYAIKADGTLWAWGVNTLGELGDNSTITSATPVQVHGLSGVTAVAGGNETGYAVAGGAVYAWGSNSAGQLGNGSMADSAVPVAVTGMTGAIAVSGGYDSGYALRGDGTIAAWGDNSSGQLGNGGSSDSAVPVAVAGVTTAIALSAGSSDGYAVLSSGSVMSWGYNGNSQLGNGGSDYANHPVPALVSGLTGIIGIAARADSVFALKAS